MCNLRAHNNAPQVDVFPPAGEFMRGRDHRCSSEIGPTPANANAPAHVLPQTLTLKIKVFIETPRRFTDELTVSTPTPHVERTTYSCEDGSGAHGTIFAALDDSIRTHWNDKLWLGVPSDATIQRLNCQVALERVTDQADANLSIKVLYRYRAPRGAHPETQFFRSFCVRGGLSGARSTDSVLAYPETGRGENGQASDFDCTRTLRTNDLGREEITQNTACHEFGHFLGLNHTCTSRTGGDTNAAIAYCDGLARARQEDMMAAGNVVRRQHGYLWVTRLRQHHYFCEHRFVATPYSVELP